MDQKGPEQHTPAPVDVSTLRNHFKLTYKLDDDQVELMIQSSAKSLCNVFSAAEEALQQDDFYDPLGRVGHSLKGLLLNMGQADWAEVARSMEQAAKERQEHDYVRLVESIRAGMAAVAEYEPEGESLLPEDNC